MRAVRPTPNRQPARTLLHPAPDPVLPRTDPTDPLQALRHATAARHADLDSSLPIARENATLQDYAGHLQALAAWLQVLTPELAALQQGVPGFAFTPPQRLEALRNDLADMPTAAPWPAASTAMHTGIARALARHPGQEDAVRWGLAYVVEGSQLGGQVMYRSLADRLAPHPLRYLQGQGAGTGARWKAFLGLLRAHLATAAAQAAACDGAVAAFEGLQVHGANAPGAAA